MKLWNNKTGKGDSKPQPGKIVPGYDGMEGNASDEKNPAHSNAYVVR